MFEGTLSASNLASLLQRSHTESVVRVDLTEVDRVEYAALAELLVIAAGYAAHRQQLEFTYPCSRVLRNEQDHIAVGRNARIGSKEHLARSSAIARSRRRLALRRELLENGFDDALKEVFSLCGFAAGLEIKGAAIRGESTQATPATVRHAPFHWTLVPSAGSAGIPLSAEVLADVLSQSGSIVPPIEATSISRYIVDELVQNVQDHAFASTQDAPRLILTGAIALWPGSEFRNYYGPNGESVYLIPDEISRAPAVAIVSIADNGVGIPNTLSLSERDRDYLSRWSPPLRPDAGESERSLVYSFHPLSTRRQKLPREKPLLRGLAYVTGQARRHEGVVRARSATATANWTFPAGGRNVHTWTHSRFPGTAVTATLAATSRSPLQSASVAHLRNRDVRLLPLPIYESACEDAFFDEVIALGGKAPSSGKEIVAFSLEPPATGSSDRHILQALNTVASAVLDWPHSPPWFCLIPASRDYITARILGVDETTVATEQLRASSVPKLTNPVLVSAIDGAFFWIGGSADERANLTRLSGLGHPPHYQGSEESQSPPPRRPVSPWLGLTSEDFPVAGPDDLKAGVTAAVRDYLHSMVVGSASTLGVQGVRNEPTLLRSLRVARPYVDLDVVVGSAHLNTALAFVLHAELSQLRPNVTSEPTLVHTTSVPRGVASILGSHSVSEYLRTEPVSTHPHPTKGHVVVIDGILASGNELRSEVASLIKVGKVPSGVVGILDARDVQDAHMPHIQSVFRRISIRYVSTCPLLSDPSATGLPLPQDRSSAPLLSLARSHTKSDVIQAILDAAPESVHLGHYVRRRGRHMDVFVDVKSLFPIHNNSDVMAAARTDLQNIVRREATEWAADAEAGDGPPIGIIVFFPADDPDLAGAFAGWASQHLEAAIGAPTHLQPLERELTGAHNKAEPQWGAVIVDWGAVTARSLQSMLVNVAARGFRRILALVLTSQLDPADEISTASIAAIRNPQVPSEAHSRDLEARVRTVFLTHLDLGHALESDCRICRTRDELRRIAENASYGPVIRERAAARFAKMRPVPVNSSEPSGMSDRATIGPRLLALRDRLGRCRWVNDEKLAVLNELQQLGNADDFSPLDPRCQTWIRLVVNEPEWMAGSPIDLADFRSALAMICSRSLDVLLDWESGETLMLTKLPQKVPDGRALHELQSLYLLGMRVCAKDEFLRTLPQVAQRAHRESVLLDGLLLVAGFLDRPYHHSSEALGLVSDSLSQIASAVLERSDSSFPQVRSEVQVLQRLVEVYYRRTDHDYQAQDAWRALTNLYVGPQDRHDGLRVDVDALMLEVKSEATAQAVSEPDPARRRDTVQRLLRDPWEACARVLSTDVMPPLLPLKDQIETLIQLLSRQESPAARGTRDVYDQELWENRLLSETPSLFNEAEDLLTSLERQHLGAPSVLEQFWSLLNWVYNAVLRTSPKGSALLYQLVRSVPVQTGQIQDIFEEQASRVGLNPDNFTFIVADSETTAFASIFCVQYILERVMENVVGHRASDVELKDVLVRAIYSQAGEDRIRLRILNTATDSEFAIGNRGGLSAANRVASPFGGAVHNVPLDAVDQGSIPWTFCVDLELPCWSSEIARGA